MKLVNSFLSFNAEEYLKDYDTILPEYKLILDEIFSKCSRFLDIFPSDVKKIFGKPSQYIDYLFDKNINYNSVLNTLIKITIENKEKALQLIKKYKYSYSRGMIYQVETGEGKSCIIAIIAAILAINGKMVHITSSNINLANRDYMNSYDFFKLLKLKSAVFLHENELPVSPIKTQQNFINNNNNNNSNNNNNTNNDQISDDEDENIFKDNMNNYYKYHTQIDKTGYAKYYYNNDSDYYDAKQFKNSSKMNFCVCGIDSNNTITKNRPNIIYSTFVNLELFYLKMMEIIKIVFY